MQTITEGKATINASAETKISKQMEVFYNPRMKINRDLTIAVINAWEKNNLQIADPFAASGIRTIRILKECKKEKIESIWLNDHSSDAIEQIKKNFKLNFPEKSLMNKVNVEIFMKDANMFLLESQGFDYIDLDPFGSPVSFLDSACKRIARDGILAVTATDTSALCGAFPDACKRKYAATPLHSSIMHEIGLRILIKKCQEVAAQYDRALCPLFSYAKDHYMRVFFECKKGKTKANEIVEQHKIIKMNNEHVGPLWMGLLWDKAFVKIMKTEEEETKKFLDVIKEEAEIEQVGFYEIHALCKRNKLHIPQYAPLMRAINEAGHRVARTHFSLNGMRSTISENELLERIRKMSE